MTEEVARRLIDNVWVTNVEAQGGSGGGGITRVTSDDETVTITNPTGPTVDLSAGGGSQPGAAIAKGPYPVGHADFAGAAYLDPFTIFTPTVGQVVLGIWIDPATWVAFNADATNMNVGQNLDFDNLPNGWINGGSGWNATQTADAWPNTSSNRTVIAQAIASVIYSQPVVLITSTDPVTVAFDPAGPPTMPPTAGHVDLYFLIATPVAP